MALVIGTRLGPYEIVGPLGAGGMGEVYRARDTKLNRDVALKILPDAFATDVDRLARFRREAQVLASLNHPNIGHIYGFEESGASHAIVMELVEGPTLADRIKQGPIALADALPIARQIADALEAAHEQGIVHRDLKPANVRVRADGTVKVLDFGLAKALGTDPVSAAVDAMNLPTVTSPAMTDRGVILGTAAYMAPEQARGQPVDKRADIWAFGCVLYEMLTGRRPFDGTTVSDVLAAVLRAEIDWQRLPLDTPSPVRRLLARCLERDPKRRLRDIGEARLELEGGAPATLGPRAIGRPERPPRMPILVGAAALVVVAAAGGWWVGQWRESRSSSSPGVNTAFTIDPPTDGAVGNGGTTLPRGVLAVSPDGTRIAYRVSLGPIRRLYVRSLDSLTARPLDGVDDAIYPFWSPDSRELAFCHDGKLKRLLIDGGTPQVVADCEEPRMPGSWGTDGTILFVPNYLGPLMRVSAAGGPVTPVQSAVPDAYQAFFSPAWLPDGKHFLVVRYFYREDPRDQAGVFVGTVGSPDLVAVVSGRVEAAGVADGRLLFIRDGALIAQPFDVARQKSGGQPQTIANHVVAFSAAGGTIAYFNPPHGLALNNRIAWFGRNGTRLSYTAEPGTYKDPRISPDGRSLAVSQGDENGLPRVWSYDIARNAGVPISSAGGVAPVWSSSGLELLASEANVVRYRLSGGPGIELRTGDLGPFDVSPDGATLLTWSYNNNGNTLVAIEASHPTKSSVVATSSGGVAHAVFSPDGHWVAYAASESARSQDLETWRVYAAPFQGPGPRVPVSSIAGYHPRWRRDGRELFFLGTDDQMYAVDVTRAGAALAFGSARPLFRQHMLHGNFDYDVTADGQRFVAIIQGGLDRSPVTVLRNWTPAAKVK
jgi:serine/threonine protein kinase/Tol biopolymer transport system component